VVAHFDQNIVLQKDEKTTTAQCRCPVATLNKLKNSMSHVKNVEAFEKLLGICTGYGEQYNPGQPNLRVENLSAIFNRARTALLNVSVAKTNFENATNSREVAFKEIRDLAIRILAELKSTDALRQTVDDARGMVRKIKGYASIDRAAIGSTKAKQQGEPPTPARNRVSGTDFGSVAFHFEKLLQTMVTEPLYQPAAPELQVQSLQDKLISLYQKNTSAIEASAELGKVRRERNSVLYTAKGNMHSIAMAVKQQAKALFGNKSEATRAASRVRFTKSKIK
jgi:hypothetical protein